MPKIKSIASASVQAVHNCTRKYNNLYYQAKQTINICIRYIRSGHKRLACTRNFIRYQDHKSANLINSAAESAQSLSHLAAARAGFEIFKNRDFILHLD